MNKIYLKLTAIASIIGSIILFTARQIPGNSIADKLLYISTLLQLYQLEVILALIAASLTTVIYSTSHIWLNPITFNAINHIINNRHRNNLYIFTTAFIIAVFSLTAYPILKNTLRYNYIHIREDLPSSQIRRIILLEARAAEAAGNLELSIEKLHRFKDLFTERAEENKILSEIARIEKKIAEATELDNQANSTETLKGTTLRVLESRIAAVTIWPQNKKMRDSLVASYQSWMQYNEQLTSLKEWCTSNSGSPTNTIIAKSLVAMGYAQMSDFYGSTSANEALPLICPIVFNATHNPKNRAAIGENAQAIIARTSPEMLNKAAHDWTRKSWGAKLNQYAPESMEHLSKLPFYNLFGTMAVDSTYELSDYRDGTEEQTKELPEISDSLAPTPFKIADKNDKPTESDYTKLPLRVYELGPLTFSICWNDDQSKQGITFGVNSQPKPIKSCKYLKSNEKVYKISSFKRVNSLARLLNASITEAADSGTPNSSLISDLCEFRLAIENSIPENAIDIPNACK